MIQPLVFTQVSGVTASDDDLGFGERQCGLKFPAAFCEFCRKYNGGFPDQQNNFFFVPEKFAEFQAEFGREDGFWAWGLYGLTTDLKQCDVIRVRESLAKLNIPLFPVAYDLTGNDVVIRIEDPEGAVFLRDHELWASTAKLFPIADNLEAFYNGLECSPFTD